jgi:hypothetical protein
MEIVSLSKTEFIDECVVRVSDYVLLHDGDLYSPDVDAICMIEEFYDRVIGIGIEPNIEVGVSGLLYKWYR